jgi:hypothetical protein
VVVRGGADLDGPHLKHWGLPRQVLANRGDHVALTSLSYVRVACVAWREGSCATPRTR